MRNSIYILSGILLFIIAVAWGVNKYIALNNAEDDYNVDLFSLIPSDNKTIFYTDNFTNYEKKLSENKYFQDHIINLPDRERPFLNKVFKLMQEDRIPVEILSKELIISFNETDPNKPLFLFKVHDKDKSGIIALIDDVIFPGYEPIKEKYKEATVYYYPLADDEFFCCTLFKGYFAGSKNRKQVEKVIDDDVITDNQFAEMTVSRGKDVIGSLFLQKKDLLLNDTLSSYWTTFDLYLEKGKIGFTGFCKMPDSYTVSDARNQEAVPFPTGHLFPKQTLSFYFSGLSDYPFYLLQKGLYHQDSASFFLNDSINCISYFKRNFKQYLLSIHYKDSIGALRTIYRIEMEDSAKAFNTFQREIRQMKNNYSLHQILINNRTVVIFELLKSGFVSKAFGDEFNSQGEKEFISFQGNAMLASDSISTIYGYLSEMESDSQAVNLAEEKLQKDFSENCNGILWANFKDSPETIIMEREKIKGLFNDFIPLIDCQVGIQWSFENSLLYKNISIRQIP